MEAQLLTTLLLDETMGWVGWLMLISVVVAFGVGMLTKYLVSIAKNVKALKKELSAPDYKKQIKAENNINNVLRTIKHDLVADRVFVLQYHNGVYSIANNSLLKLSMTHESISPGTRSSINTFQNIPSSYFGSWNSDIFDGRYITIPSVEDEKSSSEHRAMVQMLQGGDVKSLYLFPIEDSIGKTFGIGAVEYTRKETELSSEWVHWAKRRFSGIGALLAGPGDKDE